jgi:cellulose synthase/poly-beta-1,6-N-acetylglucosamine synthase-like glycosyltransferase
MRPLARRLLAAGGVLLGLATLPFLAFGALLPFVDRRPSHPPLPDDDLPTVSIVLPTYNEAGIVEAKLDDLLALDYPMDRVELVVVDSSDDETPALVRRYVRDRDGPELTLIREETRRGLAVALNEAYAAASNEVVVKTDCDSKVAPDALRAAVATLADPEVAAVTGRNADVLGDSAVEESYRGVQARVQRLESWLDSTLIFHGPFSAFERDAIVPIDEDSIADDTELALKIRRNGDRVVFDPDVRYREAAHSGLRERRGQKDRRAMGLLRLLWRHRDAVGGYGLYGRVVLPFNWWFMVVSPWLVALGLAAVSAGALLTGGLGLVAVGALAAFVVAGSSDALGPLQPAYALFDTQVSLFRASVKLLRGEGDGTWEPDAALREAFD